MIVLPEFSYATRKRINRFIWRPLRQLAQVVHPVPLLSAFLLFVLLAHVGQMHELYFSYLERPFGLDSTLHLAFAFLTLTLLSGALLYANHALSTIRIDVIYSQTANYAVDTRLRLLRNIVGWVAALTPWLGLAWGLGKAGARAREHVERLHETIGPVLGQLGDMSPKLEAMAHLPTRMVVAAWLTALAGAGLVYMLHRSRQNDRIRVTGLGIGIGVMVVVLILPSLLTGAGVYWNASSLRVIDTVPYYRLIGPLAMSLIVGLGLVAILAVLSFLSGQIGFPLVSVVFILTIVAAILRWPIERIVWTIIVILVLVAILGVLSHRRHLAMLSAFIAAFTFSVERKMGGSSVGLVQEGAQIAVRDKLGDGFGKWLAHNKTERDTFHSRRGRPYPVFIIAAQGGGIYAASAAASFLAQLQDHCPSFARHVFAISGVSGGAVGSAVFQSMMQAARSEGSGCSSRPEDAPADTLAARTSAVVQDDHLSPLLGMLLADLLGLQRDRAVALEQSFVFSVEKHGGVTALGETFDKHWRPGGGPALLLNATWVETGYRVAFAPFTLSGMRDGTLYTFGDASLAVGAAANLSLAGAAVVSARFPGVVPAFSFDRPTVRNGQKTTARWNFVDGGYSDDSGSATALEIYQALEPIAKVENVDLRLILLTSARPEPDFDGIEGTVARDVLAPGLTLLKVRDLLSRQAVMRTISEVEKGDNAMALKQKRSPAQLGLEDGWKVTVVELDHESFTLALGWKISDSTHTIVSLLLGRPNICDAMVKDSGVAPGEANEEEAEKGRSLRISSKTIRANSCVMQSIWKLVDAGP